MRPFTRKYTERYFSVEPSQQGGCVFHSLRARLSLLLMVAVS